MILAPLIEAENNAIQLFDAIQNHGLIQIGKSEKELNEEIFALAKKLFGIEKFWHKRIVRAGKNTLCPYKENPPNLILQENDILFFDFGPVFDEFEADLGRTYVLGADDRMLQLKMDVELVWDEVYQFYLSNSSTITGAELYNFACQAANNKGWEYGNEHAGHLIGKFPHEKILLEETRNYIHPENKEKMSTPDRFGNDRYWILEIHLVDTQNQIGAFFEQLMR